MPVYQDYVVRTKVTEGVGYVGKAKSPIIEYYYTYGRFPTDNQMAGISPATDITGTWLTSLEVIAAADADAPPSDGSIRLTFNIPGMGANNQLIFYPISAPGRKIVGWGCKHEFATVIHTNFRPNNCR